MIHTSYWRPRVYPYLKDVAPTQIDRLQDLTAASTLNREKIREIGRDGIVDWRKRIPSTRLTLRQFEYGDIEFWRKLANVTNATNSITLGDFKTSMVDIVGYKTDDDGTFLGSVWYPKFRVAGWGLNIGDPQASIERTFDLIGEDENLLEYNNKYFIYKKFDASGGSPEEFSVTDPVPSADPDNSGQYLFRVLRVNISDNSTDELTYTTDTPTGDEYAFSAPSTLTVPTSAGDVIKVYYSASSYISGQEVFTNNDIDAGTLLAEAASIYIYQASNNYVYKLQSVGVDVTFDRTDYYEIGNRDVQQRGVREKTVRITLGRILEAYTIEEVLRGVDSTFGRISTREYRNDLILRVKLYGNYLKNTFNIGYRFADLSPTDLGHGVPLNDYSTRNVTLQGEDCTISIDDTVIDA